jgi:hypothetical protein
MAPAAAAGRTLPPRAMPFLLFLRRHGFALAFTALLGTSFYVNQHYNQRFIGAVDWYGYYQEALLLKSGRVTLPLELPVDEFPSVVPLGFNALADGRVVPQYPPGYPLLLAAAMVFHLEFYLMPLVGLASSLVLFGLVRDLTGDKWTAGLYAVLWAFFPIVTFGSTTLMSDLVAALFLMLTYWLYRRGQVFWSAFAMTFALCVRPTNGLFLVVFAVPLLRDRKLIRYGLCLLLPGLVYGYYNYRFFGAPWRTGYADIRTDLVPGLFFPHLDFYLQQIFLQFSPLVLLLALGGFTRPRGEKFFFLAWFAAFLLFYSFWRSGGSDRWWWCRFLLPGFAPGFLLSALGFSRVRTWLDERLAAGPRRLAAHLVLFAVIGVTPVYYVKFGLAQRDLWSTNKGRDYYQVVKLTEKIVPPGGYVGSVEFAGSHRLYTQLGSFCTMHDNSPKLVAHLLAQGRPVYILVEPWNKSHVVVQELLGRFTATKLQVIDLWGGIALYRLTPRPAP